MFQSTKERSYFDLITKALQNLEDQKGSSAQIVSYIENDCSIKVDKQKISQQLSKNFKIVTHQSYKLLKADLYASSFSAQPSLKDMILRAMSQLPTKQGSIDDILKSMIDLFGKDQVCSKTNQMILSFNDHENASAMSSLRQKVQKVISRFKDLLFQVQPVEYSFKTL